MQRRRKSIRSRLIKFYAREDQNLSMSAVHGHFATSNSHINYYVDVTSLKSRAKDAQDAARSICHKMIYNITDVDTIVCLDGTEVIGAFLAQELENNQSFNEKHPNETIYVVTPETNSIGQLLFRENVRPAVEGKNIVLLLATMTTGGTVRKSLEFIEYYGGRTVGVSSIFSTMTEVAHTQVFPLFTIDDLPGYETYSPNECPFCKKGIPIEAMVNGFGYSNLQ